MAKDKSEDWQALYDRILIIYPEMTYVAKPTRAAIADFEKKCKFVLPNSYCDFIRVFGPGRIGARFRLYAPGYLSTLNYKCDLSVFNTDFQSWNKDLGLNPTTYKDEPLIRRLVVFSKTIGGDIIGWDPQDVRDEAAREYGIYYWPYGCKDVSLIATSFKSFIKEFCLGVGYFRFWKMKPEWDLDDEQQSFRPDEDLERFADSSISKPRALAKRQGKQQSKARRKETSPTSGARRLFAFMDGSSDKFWEIERKGTSVTVRFGRHGTKGQTKTKNFTSESAACKHFERLIREKLNKGYLESK